MWIGLIFKLFNNKIDILPFGWFIVDSDLYINYQDSVVLIMLKIIKIEL